MTHTFALTIYLGLRVYYTWRRVRASFIPVRFRRSWCMVTLLLCIAVCIRWFHSLATWNFPFTPDSFHPSFTQLASYTHTTSYRFDVASTVHYHRVPWAINRDFMEWFSISHIWLHVDWHFPQLVTWSHFKHASSFVWRDLFYIYMMLAHGLIIRVGRNLFACALTDAFRIGIACVLSWLAYTQLNLTYRQQYDVYHIPHNSNKNVRIFQWRCATFILVCWIHTLCFIDVWWFHIQHTHTSDWATLLLPIVCIEMMDGFQMAYIKHDLNNVPQSSQCRSELDILLYWSKNQLERLVNGSSRSVACKTSVACALVRRLMHQGCFPVDSTSCLSYKVIADWKNMQMFESMSILGIWNTHITPADMLVFFCDVRLYGTPRRASAISLPSSTRHAFMTWTAHPIFFCHTHETQSIEYAHAYAIQWIRVLSRFAEMTSVEFALNRMRYCNEMTHLWNKMCRMCSVQLENLVSHYSILRARTLTVGKTSIGLVSDRLKRAHVCQRLQTVSAVAAHAYQQQQQHLCRVRQTLICSSHMGTHNDRITHLLHRLTSLYKTPNGATPWWDCGTAAHIRVGFSLSSWMPMHRIEMHPRDSTTYQTTHCDTHSVAVCMNRFFESYDWACMIQHIKSCATQPMFHRHDLLFFLHTRLQQFPWYPFICIQLTHDAPYASVCLLIQTWLDTYTNGLFTKINSSWIYLTTFACVLVKLSSALSIGHNSVVLNVMANECLRDIGRLADLPRVTHVIYDNICPMRFRVSDSIEQRARMLASYIGFMPLCLFVDHAQLDAFAYAAGRMRSYPLMQDLLVNLLHVSDEFKPSAQHIIRIFCAAFVRCYTTSTSFASCVQPMFQMNVKSVITACAKRIIDASSQHVWYVTIEDAVLWGYLDYWLFRSNHNNAPVWFQFLPWSYQAWTHKYVHMKQHELRDMEEYATLYAGLDHFDDEQKQLQVVNESESDARYFSVFDDRMFL